MGKGVVWGGWLFAAALFLPISAQASEQWVATHYCACRICCGKTDGITASGQKAMPGMTVACNWLPFGTIIQIDGKNYVVEDRGARSEFGDKNHHKKRVDIFVSSHKEALRLGRKTVSVQIQEVPNGSGR